MIGSCASALKQMLSGLTADMPFLPPLCEPVMGLICLALALNSRSDEFKNRSYQLFVTKLLTYFNFLQICVMAMEHLRFEDVLIQNSCTWGSILRTIYYLLQGRGAEGVSLQHVWRCNIRTWSFGGYAPLANKTLIIWLWCILCVVVVVVVVVVLVRTPW